MSATIIGDWAITGEPPSAPGTPFILTQTLGTLRNNYTGCVGFAFSLPADITVVALGRYKVAGNSGTHTIYMQDGSGNILISASVDMTQTAESDGYVYTAITPTVVSGGTVPATFECYITSSETSGGDQWYDNDTIITSTSGVSGAIADQGAVNDVCGVGVPGGYGNAASSYGPVNFKTL